MNIQGWFPLGLAVWSGHSSTHNTTSWQCPATRLLVLIWEVPLALFTHQQAVVNFQTKASLLSLRTWGPSLYSTDQLQGLKWLLVNAHTQWFLEVAKMVAPESGGCPFSQPVPQPWVSWEVREEALNGGVSMLVPQSLARSEKSRRSVGGSWQARPWQVSLWWHPRRMSRRQWQHGFDVFTSALGTSQIRIFSHLARPLSGWCFVSSSCTFVIFPLM